MSGDVTDPQTLNRYPYVRNNPTNMTDPSGLFGVDVSVCFGDCGGGFDFSIGWGGGGGNWDWGSGPEAPSKTPANVGQNPNPPNGTLTSDDPFSGETNGIPNGMQIPTLGIWGLTLPSDPGCFFGTCGNVDFGSDLFGGNSFNLGKWAACTENNRLDNALRRLGQAYGHPIVGEIAADLTLGAMAEPIADYTLGAKVPGLLGRGPHSSTWLRRVGFPRAGRVVSNVAAGIVLFEGAYDAQVMLRCAISPKSF